MPHVDLLHFKSLPQRKPADDYRGFHVYWYPDTPHGVVQWYAINPYGKDAPVVRAATLELLRIEIDGWWSLDVDGV